MKKRFISLIMALAMIFTLSLSTTVFAAESSADALATDGTAVELVPIEDAGISREEAIAILGLTEDEAENCMFLATSEELPEGSGTLNISPRSIIIPSGTAKYFDEFSFTGSKTGSNHWIVGGQYFGWVAGLRSISNANATVSVYVHRAGNNSVVDSNSVRGAGNTCRSTRTLSVSQYGSEFYFSYSTASGVTATLLMAVVTSENP